LFSIFVGLVTAIALAGCAAPTPADPAGPTADPDVVSFDEEARAWLTDPAEDGVLDGPRGAVDADALPQQGNWTVLLAKLSGLGPEQLAGVLSTIRELVPDARIEERSAGTFVSVGSFADPTSPEAQTLLDRVRGARVQTESGTAAPYRFAFFSPPDGSDLSGSVPEYDLRLVRQSNPASRLFTLQIGIYGRVDNTPVSASDVAQFRAAAEEAVQRLRADGEAAYYYHAAQRSTVTLGIFGDRDYDTRTRPALESIDVRELRARFPYNLVNGATLKQWGRDESGRRVEKVQPSFMVVVPEK
jgi:hypothetical protein